MASLPATQASVNRVVLGRAMAQPFSSFAEVLEMVTIQRDGVQHFDPTKIITGAGVRVSDLSLDGALAELLGAIATTSQSADAMDSSMTGSMFAAFTNADGITAVKTAAALAVICKLATERLWPATSADGDSHGGMRHLDGLILLLTRQEPPPVLTGPQQQSQHPSTPPPPQEIEDSTLGKRPRDEPTATNDGDTSGAGATLLTTITPARQLRLSFYVLLHVASTRYLIFEGGLQSGTHSRSGGSARSGAQDKHTERSKALRRKHGPALHICWTQATCTGVVKIETMPTS